VRKSLVLEGVFSDEETKTTVFISYAKGAPGHDEFLFLFYQ
jgi:hypothetical protein